MKTIIGWIGLTVLLVTLFAPEKTQAVAEEKLSISATNQTAVRLWLTTVPEDAYQVFGTTNLKSWDLISSQVAASTSLSLTLPKAGKQGYYRAERTPVVGGRIALTNGTVLSGMVRVTADFYSSANSGVIYAKLVDICQGETNFLADTGVTAVQNWYCLTSADFIFDSALLKNDVPHDLRLFVVDNCGMVNAEGVVTNSSTEWVRERLCNPVKVWVNNPVSLQTLDVVDGPPRIGWKFYVRATPLYPVGAWRVSVTNDLGQTILTGSGAYDLATNGEVEIADSNANFAGYPGKTAGFVLTFSSPGQPDISIYRTAVLDKPAGGIEWPNESGAAVCLEQSSVVGQRERLNGTLIHFQTKLQQIWRCFDLRSQTWKDDQMINWSTITSPGDWYTVSWLMNGGFTAVPTHVYLWSPGGPMFFGDHGYGSRLSPLEWGWPTNRVTFLVVDGFNLPYGLIYRLVGTKVFTREQAIREGRYPCVALFFAGKEFFRYSQPYIGGDIDAALAGFWKRFVDLAFETDPWTTERLRTIQQALDQIAAEGNPVVRCLKTVGCTDMKADQTFWRPILPM